MPRKTTKTVRKTRAALTSQPAADRLSVVPSTYRERYVDGNCGDDLALKLKKHITTDYGTTDVATLQKLAEANDVWRPEYANLNPGLARMTVGNRLRALARNGSKLAWR